MAQTATAPAPESKKSTVEPSIPKTSEKSNVERRVNIIKTKFSESPWKCKVHHLWGNYFRVNLQDMENQSVVVDSYFVTFNEKDEVNLSQEVKPFKMES